METSQSSLRSTPQVSLDRREALSLLLPYRDRIAAWQIEAARLEAVSAYRRLSPSQVIQLDTLMREIDNCRRELRTELQNEGRAVRQSSLVRDTLKAIDSARAAVSRVVRPD